MSAYPVQKWFEVRGPFLNGKVVVYRYEAEAISEFDTLSEAQSWVAGLAASIDGSTP